MHRRRVYIYLPLAPMNEIERVVRECDECDAMTKLPALIKNASHLGFDALQIIVGTYSAEHILRLMELAPDPFTYFPSMALTVINLRPSSGTVTSRFPLHTRTYTKLESDGYGALLAELLPLVLNVHCHTRYHINYLLSLLTHNGREEYTRTWIDDYLAKTYDAAILRTGLREHFNTYKCGERMKATLATYIK